MKNLLLRILFLTTIGLGLYCAPLLITEISQRMGWIPVPTDDLWTTFKTQMLIQAFGLSAAMFFLLICNPEPKDEGDRQ